MSIREKLLDLVFPPRCPFCGGPEQSVDGRGCPRCRDADLWIPLADRVTPGEHYVRCVCVGWYRDDLRASVRRFKFGGRQGYAAEYGKALAESVRLFLPGAYDCIAWMPVSAQRRKERGYDQAELLARALAAEVGKPVRSLLVKVRDNPPQSSLDGRARRDNVAGAYAPAPGAEAAGLRVLLVDDILTTGSTLEEGSRTLREAGAAQVVAAALCRTPEQKKKA